MKTDSPSTLQRGSTPSERGSTLVEFALTFILLMLFVLGISAFGHALYVYHFLSNSAREATRFASVHGSTCNDDLSCSTTGGPATDSNSVVDDYVRTMIPPGVDSSQLTTSVTYPLVSGGPTDCASTKNAPGCTVQVQLSYNFRFIFPLLPSSPFTLSSTSDMVVAH